MLTRFAIALIISLLSTVSASATASPVSPQIPFLFVANQGQAESRVRYIGTGPEFKAWFEDSGVILQQGQTAVGISFGSSAAPRITAENPVGARANYLRGSDPRGWQRDLPLFSMIRYSGLWPGIDLTYKADRAKVKAEYLVSPGADPARIALVFDGNAEIRADGTLRIGGTSGDFCIEDAPVLYQLTNGKRVEVRGGFERHPDGAIGFWIAAITIVRSLSVIDPSILFSGYFGGSTEDDITAIGIDPLNNIVVAGWTASHRPSRHRRRTERKTAAVSMPSLRAFSPTAEH